MGILNDLSHWRRARKIEREAVIDGPDDHQTFVWDLGNDVGVIQKKKDGKFLGFRVEEGKTFGRVVGALKRQRKRLASKGVKQ